MVYEILALSSADLSADAAADLLAELSGSGSESTSDRDACSMTVAAAEELALGEELAGTSSLEDIAAGPRREACGNSRLSKQNQRKSGSISSTMMSIRGLDSRSDEYG